MSVQSEWVTLTVGDGTTMRAWVARPEGPSPRRGLLVFQEAFGVNAHIRDVVFSNADHGFFCDARASYHPAAAAQAWSLTHAFFDTHCQR